MDKFLSSIIFVLFLLLAALSVTAQTNNSPNSSDRIQQQTTEENIRLPLNRTAFLFSVSNSEYSNPALAVLNTKSYSKNNQEQTKINSVSVASLSKNKIKHSSISEEDICMFSNATEDELWIKINEQLNIENAVEIYNEQGIRIYHSVFNNNLHKINLCDLMAGTFLVKLGDNVQKIIIE